VVLTPSQTRVLYRRLAPRYDRLVGLFASRVPRVADVGCGAGRSFPWLERAVTASGHIVCVDLTDAMLREAQHHVERAG